MIFDESTESDSSLQRRETASPSTVMPRLFFCASARRDIKSIVTPRALFPPAHTTMPTGTSLMVLSGICKTTVFSLTSFTIVPVKMSIFDSLNVDTV
jgi:hypothetical protein